MAINFDPNCVEAYVKYSHMYFDINPEMAIGKLEELLQKAPESALAQRELAEAYYKNQQYTKAAAAYETYVANPNHFEEDRARLATLLSIASVSTNPTILLNLSWQKSLIILC